MDSVCLTFVDTYRDEQSSHGPYSQRATALLDKISDLAKEDEIQAELSSEESTVLLERTSQ